MREEFHEVLGISGTDEVVDDLISKEQLGLYKTQFGIYPPKTSKSGYGNR